MVAWICKYDLTTTREDSPQTVMKILTCLRARLSDQPIDPIQPPSPTPLPKEPAFFKIVHYDIRKLIYEHLLSLDYSTTIVHISSSYLSGRQKLVALPCLSFCPRCHEPRHEAACTEAVREGMAQGPIDHCGHSHRYCLTRMQWERGQEPRNLLGIWGALLSCRQMHTELMRLIYTHFTFDIIYLHTLNRFFSLTPSLTLDRIQNLQVTWNMNIYIWPDRYNARIETMAFPNRTFLRKARLKPGDIILEATKPEAFQEWEDVWRKIAQMTGLRRVEVRIIHSSSPDATSDDMVAMSIRKMFERLMRMEQAGDFEESESWGEGAVLTAQKHGEAELHGWGLPSSNFVFDRFLAPSESCPGMHRIKQYYQRWYT